jgi:iron complex outermembrane receptor protein
MKTRISKIALLFSLATSLSVTAQFSIHGTVKDEKGNLLPNVKLTIENTYLGVLSSPKGIFQFHALKKGVYTLKTSFVGYESQLISIEVIDRDVAQTIQLFPSTVMLEEIQVSAVRADSKTPTTYSNLNAKQIEKNNFGQDLPYLLESTPSTVVTSDGGSGVGYTGIRIRGVDPTRTNVTINGIPLNDPESHAVYWVDLPDFASSTDNIQVQRGVGTSTNGAAAFGASVNIKSDNIEKQAYAQSDNSVGSFATLRTTLKAGTGLINNKFALDTRMSRIVSDGYVDRASSNLNSYYLSGVWLSRKSILKANVFSGKEVTYQAWWGIPEAKLKGNSDSLLTHFYNNYYPGGMYQTASDSSNLFGSAGRTYNYYTYKNQVDNYKQDHYQLHFTHTFSSKWVLNIAAHGTRGKGYYEQYQPNDQFLLYGLQPLIIGSDTISSTDLIRRRWLDNTFYGSIFSLNYNSLKHLKMTFGGGVNQYQGGHFGEVIWARYASQSEINQRYYENDATKTEVNAYLKANYQLRAWNFYGDMQVRHINYLYKGVEESYTSLIPLQEQINYTFMNPKAGVMVDINEKSNVYTSFSIANREPVRDDFIQSSKVSRPKPEQLQNIEAGYRYHSKKLLINANYYLMNYKDQLILTGKINDVGAYNRINVPKSYRMGVELEAGYLVTKKISLTGNVTLSANKIKAFDEYIDNYDTYDSNGNMIQTIIHHTNTDIAFSPNLIASFGASFQPVKNMEITILSKYVGKQFLDNTSSSNRMLNAYYLTNLTASYSLFHWGLKEIKLGVLVNNVFNFLYENNGYTWGYIYGGKRIAENFYYPQAGRNFLLRLIVKV